MSIISKAVFAVFMLSVSACSSQQSHFIVAPQLMSSATFTSESCSATLNVADLRIDKHLVAIFRENEPTSFIASRQFLTEVIAEAMTEPWAAQGVKIVKNSTNRIDLNLNKSEVAVEQTLTSYSSVTHIEMQVTVNTSSQTLTKTFNSNGQSKGLLKADLAVLERDFNRALSTLLEQIITDQEINYFLNSQ